MKLSEDQLAGYERDGFTVVPSAFTAAEVETLATGYSEDLELDGPHVVMEPDSGRVGALYAAHLRRTEFAALVRSATLLTPVHQLLETDGVYVYQLKINVKSALGNNKVDWHQDYAAWKIADRLPAPNLVNVAVLLDDSTEFNGPLYFIPGSHKAGLTLRAGGGAMTPGQHFDPADIALGADELARLIDRNGIRSIRAEAGSVVYFHPEIVHSSPTNMSPADRRLLIITYNHSRNLPATERPEYLVGRDTAALTVTGSAAHDSMEAAL
ncbi:phytanoyl-CoA dioxygenase family protein [Nocardia sp. NPDC059764]|uniref:phytanoyl-CoA dioxygenase family protein n=1 Tax=Nocardia sp. NPDC059764 TaxID=3346939 RepID=UPI00366372D0